MQFVSFLLKKNRLSRSSLAPRLFLLKGRRAVPVFKPGHLPLRLFSLDRLVTLNPSLLQQVIGLLPHPLLSPSLPSICYCPLLWKYFLSPLRTSPVFYQHIKWCFYLHLLKSSDSFSFEFKFLLYEFCNVIRQSYMIKKLILRWLVQFIILSYKI